MGIGGGVGGGRYPDDDWVNKDERSDLGSCRTVSLLVTPHDPTAAGIVGGQLNVYAVTWEDPDEAAPSHLAGGAGQNFQPSIDCYAEHGVGKGFYNASLNPQYIVLGQEYSSTSLDQARPLASEGTASRATAGSWKARSRRCAGYLYA